MDIDITDVKNKIILAEIVKLKKEMIQIKKNIKDLHEDINANKKFTFRLFIIFGCLLMIK